MNVGTTYCRAGYGGKLDVYCVQRGYKVALILHGDDSVKTDVGERGGTGIG